MELIHWTPYSQDDHGEDGEEQGDDCLVCHFDPRHDGHLWGQQGQDKFLEWEEWHIDGLCAEP